MGYFSNGTEGDIFVANFCARCIHGQNELEGCPVDDAHRLFAYEECNNKSNAKTILDMLIERKPDLSNECKMFVPVHVAKRCRRTGCEQGAAPDRDGYCEDCS
jgi:hypothetical protein